MAAIPPVFRPQDISIATIAELREASRKYCEDYDYTCAFEKLVTTPASAAELDHVLAGKTNSDHGLMLLYQGLLAPWRSTRSLPEKRLPAIAVALSKALPLLRQIPPTVTLDGATDEHLELVVEAVSLLDSCHGVAPTIASKMVAPFRPATVIIWDSYIANAYGFAMTDTGYRRFIYLMRDVARRLRDVSGKSDVEADLRPPSRTWKAPLAKVIDEWHWIRITQVALAIVALRYREPQLRDHCMDPAAKL